MVLHNQLVDKQKLYEFESNNRINYAHLLGSKMLYAIVKNYHQLRHRSVDPLKFKCTHVLLLVH